jgi:cytochrome P450
MSSVDDPFSPVFHADPYPNYHWLRAYHPVFRNELAAGGEWLLTRHADVVAALRDPRLSSEVVPPRLIDQFAASGQPLLAGLARLFVHMLIQGRQVGPRHVDQGHERLRHAGTLLAASSIVHLVDSR